ncbi:potassium transporter KtrB, partial [candidate division MSBL1 archaeon SCGC-AAA259I09]
MVEWEKQREAVKQSVIKMDPRYLVKNPVMFVVEIGTILTLALTIYPPFFHGQEAQWYYGFITGVLLFTVLFANYAESLAELEGEAHAESLRELKTETRGKRLQKDLPLEEIAENDYEEVDGEDLKKGDLVFVEEGDTIPR